MMNFISSVNALLRIGQIQSVVANNIANIGTPGFKQDNATSGTNGVSVTTDISQGSIAVQADLLDVAVNGPGYFVVSTPQGLAYTVSGTLKATPGTLLSVENGNVFLPKVSIPYGARSVSVSSDGTVTADMGGSRQRLGQLQLANFADPSQLRKIGGNLLQETGGSGPAVLNSPGQGGTGTLSIGGLEMSNTDPARNMVTMILDTNTFAYNIKAIKVQEQMSQTLLDIKG